MSYCRWSSNNFKCDVYCYEDVNGGYTTHVAGLRVVGKVPPEPDIRKVPVEVWLAAHEDQMAFLDTAKRKPIGLPHDGESFNDPTLEAFEERLRGLKEMGYYVPKHVFRAIAEEIKERDAHDVRSDSAGDPNPDLVS